MTKKTTTQQNDLITFEVGKTYSCLPESWSMQYTVVKRTAKTVTVKPRDEWVDAHNTNPRTFRVKIAGYGERKYETFKPEGHYSGAPIVCSYLSLGGIPKPQPAPEPATPQPEQTEQQPETQTQHEKTIMEEYERIISNIRAKQQQSQPEITQSESEPQIIKFEVGKTYPETIRAIYTGRKYTVIERTAKTITVQRIDTDSWDYAYDNYITSTLEITTLYAHYDGRCRLEDFLPNMEQLRLSYDRGIIYANSMTVHELSTAITEAISKANELEKSQIQPAPSQQEVIDVEARDITEKQPAQPEPVTATEQDITPKPEDNIIRFEVGKTYANAGIDLIYGQYTVVKRTDKTITVRPHHKWDDELSDRPRLFRIKIEICGNDSYETFMHRGRKKFFGKAPTLDATCTYEAVCARMDYGYKTTIDAYKALMQKQTQPAITAPALPAHIEDKPTPAPKPRNSKPAKPQLTREAIDKCTSHDEIVDFLSNFKKSEISSFMASIGIHLGIMGTAKLPVKLPKLISYCAAKILQKRNAPQQPTTPSTPKSKIYYTTPAPAVRQDKHGQLMFVFEEKAQSTQHEVITPSKKRAPAPARRGKKRCHRHSVKVKAL